MKLHVVPLPSVDLSAFFFLTRIACQEENAANSIRTEAIMSTRTTTTIKTCRVCGRNVVNEPRTKDDAGHYYCHPCWEEAQRTQYDTNPSDAEHVTSPRPVINTSPQRLVHAVRPGCELRVIEPSVASASTSPTEDRRRCFNRLGMCRWGGLPERAGRISTLPCTIRRRRSPPAVKTSRGKIRFGGWSELFRLCCAMSGY